MTRQKTKGILIAVTLLCSLAFALAELLLPIDFIMKTVMLVLLYMLPAFAVHKANEHVLYSELFTFPKKGFLTALMLGIGTFMVTASLCARVAPYVDLQPLALRLQTRMGSYTDMALSVTVYVALADAVMAEFFFRGFSFFNLTHTAGKPFAHWFSAIAFTVYTGVRTFGLFPPVIWAAILAVSFGAGILFHFMYLRFQTLYHSAFVHTGFNVAVYVSAMTLLELPA